MSDEFSHDDDAEARRWWSPSNPVNEIVKITKATGANYMMVSDDKEFMIICVLGEDEIADVQTAMRQVQAGWDSL